MDLYEQPFQRIQYDVSAGRDIQMRVLGPAPAPQGPVASRQTRLQLAIERLNLRDAAGRALISSGVEALLASLLSEQSINALVRVGLAREVVEANVLQAMENTLGGLSPTGLATDVVRSAIIDAVAVALEQAVFSRAPASTLPASWQAPLRALVRASFAEGAGLVLAVSNPSPTAWVAPVVDRVYDAVEIYRGITGLRQDREVFLYSVALGAEVNAELITRFPGASSQSVLDQWRSDTRNNLRSMVGPGAVEAVSQVIATGQAALTAQRRGNAAEVARLVLQLQQRADQFNLPTLSGTRSPRELVLNLVNAGDAASSLARVFLSGTALRDGEQEVTVNEVTRPPKSEWFANWTYRLTNGESTSDFDTAAKTITASGTNAPDSLARVVDIHAVGSRRMLLRMVGGPCRADSFRLEQAFVQPVILSEHSNAVRIGDLYFDVPLGTPQQGWSGRMREAWALRKANDHEMQAYESCRWDTFDTLRAYIAQFPGGRFLAQGDPPGWFGGQCVAWAKALFGLVASRPIDSLRGYAGELPGNLRALGFDVSEDPAAPRIGAMVAWSDGRFGHVGVVTQVHRSPVSNQITEITVSEANWGAITEEGARRWELSLAEARREFVTESYGTARSTRLQVNNLTRGSYRFSAYVYP